MNGESGFGKFLSGAGNFFGNMFGSGDAGSIVSEAGSLM